MSSLQIYCVELLKLCLMVYNKISKYFQIGLLCVKDAEVSSWIYIYSHNVHSIIIVQFQVSGKFSLWVKFHVKLLSCLYLKNESSYWLLLLLRKPLPPINTSRYQTSLAWFMSNVLVNTHMPLHNVYIVVYKVLFFSLTESDVALLLTFEEFLVIWWESIKFACKCNANCWHMYEFNAFCTTRKLLRSSLTIHPYYWTKIWVDDVHL